MIRFFLEKNHLIVGILAGLAIPFVSYALLLFIFDIIEGLASMQGDEVKFHWRVRTSALLAICVNLLPMHYYKRKYFTESMRGIVFPTLLYSILWVVYFAPTLF